MPAARKTAAKSSATNAKRGESHRPATQQAQLRDEASAIRAAHGYDESGELTPQMMQELQALLERPIDPHYVQTKGPTQGKPYTSTGIRTVQVQINRLNAVLGPAHWRKLLHYEDGGTTCRAHLVIGNRLGSCSLDEHGQLEADGYNVLVHREGKGGHERGRTRGDIAKGAETNALKRVIAQAGPGQDVYCLDLDEDENPATGAPPTTPAAVGQASAPADDPVVALATLLDQADDLAVLRKEIDQGMQLWGATVESRLDYLKENTTAEALQALKGRIDIALDQRDSQLSISGGPDDQG